MRISDWSSDVCSSDLEGYAQSLVDLAVDEVGTLDGAFNNAGAVGEMAPIPDMAIANWEDVIRVNLTSAFLAAKAQIPALRNRGRGSLVFTSSFVGFRSEEHTSELQSLMRISYAVFCLKKKIVRTHIRTQVNNAKIQNR